MNKKKELFTIEFLLIMLSSILYYIHYRTFGQFNTTMYYTFLDIAFIPINILIVSLVFDKLIERRERIKIMDRLNMIIGLFFNEVGNNLLNFIIKGDEKARGLINDFDDLNQVEKKIKTHEHTIEIYRVDIKKIDEILTANKTLLISLIGNDSIVEHQVFSNLLMAVVHLADELNLRRDMFITEEDYEHLQIDIERVYKSSTLLWVSYLKYLKYNYPYLYNSAMKLSIFK